MNRVLYLAAYDVRDDRRLARALKVAKRYASGGQKSAFECWLGAHERQTLLQEMRGTIDIAEDAFALIPLDPRRPIITLGIAKAPADPDFYYIA